jgi:hypothetical protein
MTSEKFTLLYSGIVRTTITLMTILIFIFTSFTGHAHEQQLQKSNPDSKSFPIMAYFSLTSEQLDIAHFRELADAGFNISLSFLGTYELNKKALDLAQQVGIKLLITDNRIQPGKPIDKTTVEELDRVVSDYKNFPALLGYFLKDEPGVDAFENMAAVKREISLHDPIHIVYGNLFPDYANSQQLGVETYNEYVAKYMEVLRPKILSYDYYPFVNTGFRDSYYKNMEVIRATALKAGIPFWAFTMSCYIDPAYPKPEESWIRLQLYSDLAYGAKGVQYFTYSLPHSDAEDFRTAILDADGKRTNLYDIAKCMNTEIHSLEVCINELNSLGVYNTAPLPEGSQQLPADFCIKSIAGGPMVVGYFKDNSGLLYLLLVNRNYKEEVDFTLTVSEKVKGLNEVSKSKQKDPAVFKVVKGEIKLKFNAGDGRLFRLL